MQETLAEHSTAELLTSAEEELDGAAHTDEAAEPADEFARNAHSSRFQSAVVEDLVNALSLAIDLESRSKISRGRRVAVIASLIGFELGYPGTPALYAGGLLQDVAAVGLPDHGFPLSVLATHPNREDILAHTDRGAEIVRQIPNMPPGTEDAVRDHHEWWLGLGYPRGKKKAEISLEGQILRLADSVHEVLSLTRARTSHSVLDHLERLSNVEFSPAIYSAFRSVIRRPGLVAELDDEWGMALLRRRVAHRLPRRPVPPRVDAMGTAATIFGRVTDSKHAYTQGHSERVSRYSMMVANEMGVPHSSVTQLRFASLLHDAGKLAIPVFILDKPGPLSHSEWEVVRMHPILTCRILSSMGALRSLATVAGSHHERVDGTGYPHMLSGEQIPLLARVMSVADAFDAMTSARPYQPDRSLDQAMDVLRQDAGAHFWPEAVAAAVKVLPAAAQSFVSGREGAAAG